MTSDTTIQTPQQSDEDLRGSLLTYARAYHQLVRTASNDARVIADRKLDEVIEFIKARNTTIAREAEIQLIDDITDLFANPPANAPDHYHADDVARMIQETKNHLDKRLNKGDS